ncbi:MAG: amine oxidase, partial [Gammaproteobacteria bacterium]|nr:amine oxidase [Gammaproteobacteria bacterium]
CLRLLDYGALDMKPFLPGAVIRHDGRFHRLADPWRQPLRALESLVSPIGSLGDKLRIASLRGRLRRRSLDDLASASETTTRQRLAEYGFSERMIDGFFRPFLGGVFLDDALDTSSRMFEFVFKMFSEGDVVVPGAGMQAIPESIAAALPRDSVRLESPVEQVCGSRCVLGSGETLEADHIVVATDGNTASRLLRGVESPRWRETVCLYFDAAEPPFDDPILMLDGDGRGPANNVCVMNRVAPDYAPPGRFLVSVSVIDGSNVGDDELERAVRSQITGWFGPVVQDWRCLRQYRIPQALPIAGPHAMPTIARTDGVIVCGDFLANPSINGAMASGREAAEAILSISR